jgi:halocyanin-like protein
MQPSGRSDDPDPDPVPAHARGVHRRAVLAGASGGLAALAGCVSGGGGAPEVSLSDWLGDLEEYGGPVDRTGRSEVVVTVGAGDDGLAFDPLAVTVDAGTTVVWEWTGRGGRHNVVGRDGAFESEYHEDEGATFEHTFDDERTYAYYCQPHRTLGMKGGVRVE